MWIRSFCMFAGRYWTKEGGEKLKKNQTQKSFRHTQKSRQEDDRGDDIPPPPQKKNPS
jgi:hypothetical protein